MSYDAAAETFRGEVVNTTSATVTQVRVEIRLSNGVTGGHGRSRPLAAVLRGRGCSGESLRMGGAVPRRDNAFTSASGASFTWATLTVAVRRKTLCAIARSIQISDSTALPPGTKWPTTLSVAVRACTMSPTSRPAYCRAAETPTMISFLPVECQHYPTLRRVGGSVDGRGDGEQGPIALMRSADRGADSRDGLGALRRGFQRSGGRRGGQPGPGGPSDVGSGLQKSVEGRLVPEGEVPGGGGDAVEAGTVQNDGERDVGAGGVVVPMAALERARLPAGEREPPLAPLDDVAQPPAGKPLEAEVVVAVDLLVPPSPLVGTRQADGGLAEEEPVRCARENLRGRRCHASSLTQDAAKSQRPQEAPAIPGRFTASSLAWDGPGLSARHGRRMCYNPGMLGQPSRIVRGLRFAARSFLCTAVLLFGPTAAPAADDILVVGGEGRHCGEDPQCMNRLHPARPGRGPAGPYVFRACDASDFDLDLDHIRRI